MIELTVKTLDSKNHAFSVPDDITVKQLKEQIADSVNIAAESQRLIYCGRVLQDDKNLSEYDVNGKVIHLVQRAPPVSNGSGPDRGPRGPSTTRSNSNTPSNRRSQQWRTLFNPGGNTSNAMYVGAMAFPAEIMDATGITMQQPRYCLSQSRLAVARNMLRRSSLILNNLENPNPPQSSSDTSPENGNESSAANAEDETSAVSEPIQDEITAEIDNQDAADAPGVEVQMEPPNDPNNATNEIDPSQPASSSDQQSSPNDTEEDTNSTRRSLRTRALAELMEQAALVNARVQPFMAQYQQLMRDDPEFSNQAAVLMNQILFDGVSEIMHNLAHAYHALSDIMCDFSHQRPRHLRCRPVLIHHSAVVQTDIPIQVSTNLGAAANGSDFQQNASSGSSRASENDTRPEEAAGTSTEEEVSHPQPQPPPPSDQAPSGGQSESATASSQSSGASSTAPAPDSERRIPFTPQPLRITRFGGPTGPGLEFFVDVAPAGAIVIDSLETHVVTNAPPPGTSTTEANANPPEFVQNLITALAGQFMGATLQQYQAQQTPSGSQQPPASSSQTSTTQQSSSPPPTAAQNSQARGNTATHPTTATQTRSTARPHVHLSPAIHGLRANSFDPFLPCNSHHIRSSRGRRVRQQQANTSSTPDTARAMPIPAPNSISIQLRAEPVMSVNVETITNQARRTTPWTGPRPADTIQLPPEVRAMYQAVQNSNTPATLGQLLQNVPGYTYTPGESIFTDIFMTLAQSLSFVDMVQLGLGNSECLVRARPQLRQLVTQQLLDNQPFTISAITQIIDRFNNELRPYYTIFDNARLREEVDLPASINLYNHSMLPSILNTVMEEDQNTFHRTLMLKCARYVRHLCAMLLYCCLEGASGLETILRSFVNQMTTGVPGFLQEWTVSHSVLNFRSFVGSLNVPTEDIKRFLVYRVGNPASASSPQPATTPPTVPPAAEPMDVQEIQITSIEVESTPTLREPPIADTPPTQHINEVVGWQNTLPSDWVPIITRDSQRQRRQNPQGPFSDAYLSGMPPKRRKLITSSKPQGNLTQVISESMATALGAAGMSTGPEVDVVAQRAGQDRSLRTAYREQVRTTLRHNLDDHPDYAPDKYPNTAKYFNQQ